MTNRIYLALKYKDAQIIKHALKEVNLFKMKNGIGQEKNECIDI